jgi:hypothetical protein
VLRKSGGGGSELLDRDLFFCAEPGIKAQRKYNPRSLRSYHGSSDYLQAVELLQYFVGSPEELNLYFRLLRVRARQDVEQLWPAIKTLAACAVGEKDLVRAGSDKDHPVCTQAETIATPRKAIRRRVTRAGEERALEFAQLLSNSPRRRSAPQRSSPIAD